MPTHPNVVFVFSDQHRAQAVGYAGNPDLKTPNLDTLAGESLSLTTAVSGIPVCTPARACLLTGQYPLTHGLFLNDVYLRPSAVSMARAFSEGGYDTAYIGKWHIDGHGRSGHIPPERRLGFEFWRTLECTHSYNDSKYYHGDESQPRKWRGYDAKAQTECAIDYIRGHDRTKPFLLVMSWGPPHAPYDGAPEPFASMYRAEDVTLRLNVPAGSEESARRDIAGYYAHVSALDAYVGQLRRTLAEEGLEEDTIFVYSSDHGDMLGSHGRIKKQQPWDESILVPFLWHYPRALGTTGRVDATPFNTPDILPTLLELAGLAVPHTVEGRSYADYYRSVCGGDERGERPAEAALIQCVSPFGQWPRGAGGVEYRGVRTDRYTYVRTLGGPWLFYDNQRDPYQLTNLVDDPASRPARDLLEEMLSALLAERHDRFLHGDAYVTMWDYPVDETGTVPWEW